MVLLVLLAALLAALEATQAVAEKGAWSQRTPGAARKLKSLQIPHGQGNCVKRISSPESVPQKAKLGIVAVFCGEHLDLYNQVGCRGGLVRFYLFLRCGNDKQRVLSLVPNIRRCMTLKTVSSTVYEDLTWAKQHSEYLGHIVTRYHQLEDSMIFASFAEEAQAGVSLAVAADLALGGGWDYKPLLPTKTPVRFDECPEPCTNAVQFGRELCALYKRYTCKADCYSCRAGTREPHENDKLAQGEGGGGSSRCFFTNPGGMFIASGRRIRELPVYEYMWLREWLLSWQEDGAGELRGLLAERMWPAALGCPEDIYSNSTESGCRSGMRFMSGRQVGPPDEMIDDGLVHTADGLHSAKHTRDQNLHDSKHSYPHILSPKYGTYRRVTFVACYGTFLRVRTLLPLVKAWLGAALRHHPTARFVLLVKHDLMATVKYRLGEEMEWFANRLEVRPVVTSYAADLGASHNAADIQAALWPEAHGIEMVSRFLRDAAQVEDPGLKYGHLIFTHLNSLVLNNLWGIFHGRPFTLALTAQEPLSEDLDTSVMAVHRSRIAQAAEAMSSALEDVAAGGGGQSFADLLRDKIVPCRGGGELVENATMGSSHPMVTVACAGNVVNATRDMDETAPQPSARNKGEGEAEESPSVRLMPCREWGALKQRGVAPAGDDPEAACGFDGLRSRVVRIDPPDGNVAWKLFERTRGSSDASLARSYVSEL